MANIRHIASQRVEDREIHELIGLARGLLANGELSDGEIDVLRKHLVQANAASDAPLIRDLNRHIEVILADGVITEDERLETAAILLDLIGETQATELGEVRKSSSLPLCTPAPAVTFAGRAFCFTGEFTFGTRKVCEAAVVERGGAARAKPSGATDFVVIGEYASDSWAMSSYGRKIQLAVDLRDQSGAKLAIISERHWLKALS